MRIIIALASMGLCATLFWGGTALVGLLMHGLTAHPLVAKAMAGLPVLVLPFVAVLVTCQQRRQGQPGAG
ncbi:hypothetical protein PMI04_007755 [Sphingobium sp. AP49]|uniref:hypothetical protein n=1 Tax=Sphingobium sp. AP49 TaxID=1144307 RepID=UPI00026EDDBE|nr:hypothetical protein [Sphingobium sp. AP49]WHO40480.1 hypothetical protein PMI04_007755 [Sphingobium sp. AP49]